MKCNVGRPVPEEVDSSSENSAHALDVVYSQARFTLFADELAAGRFSRHAGKSNAIKTAMMAITTNSSIKVQCWLKILHRLKSHGSISLRGRNTPECKGTNKRGTLG